MEANIRGDRCQVWFGTECGLRIGPCVMEVRYIWWQQQTNAKKSTCPLGSDVEMQEIQRRLDVGEQSKATTSIGGRGKYCWEGLLQSQIVF